MRYSYKHRNRGRARYPSYLKVSNVKILDFLKGGATVLKGSICNGEQPWKMII